MMVDADHLRIVFRVNGIGFVMPVADLLAIRGPDEDELTITAPLESSHQLGSFSYRDVEVVLYDLAALFGLGSCPQGDGRQYLIFTGADGPWAVPVDHVSGVMDAARFTFQDLPGYLFRDELVPYRQVAVYDGQLLVSPDVQQLDQAWRRSG